MPYQLQWQLDHIVLECRDPEASAAFYDSVLGLEPVRLAEYRAGDAPFLSARVSAETILDFFPPAMWRNPDAPENPNHFCFTAAEDDLPAVREALAAAGVEIERESPRNYGARGYGVSLYFRDPDNVSVEVRYYEGE